jgi:pimeloyl-ACP methyl ester carboxylesterase
MLKPMSSIEPADLSVYDRLCRTDAEVEAWLAASTHHRELLTYLGESEYLALAPLARTAASARVELAPVVLIIPGIMGTQLGRPNPAPWPPNLLWPDPIDVVAGRLAALVLPEPVPLITLGAICYSYLALKLRLRAAGFDARIAEYDWRQSVFSSGRTLAASIRACGAREVMLLAHSMGGLVARAALNDAASTATVSRVITLGSPHGGALAPAQALRGVYPTVRRLAAMDLVHSAEQLAADVFASFPSLYEMLPASLMDPAAWPAGPPAPRATLLQAAAVAVPRLAAADERFVCIAGTGQRTATAVQPGASGFDYEITSLGDGTVSAASAVMPRSEPRYCVCEHSALPRSAAIAAAISDLLQGGSGAAALTRAPPPLLPQSVRVSDAQLRESYASKVDWRALTSEERRRYFNQLNLAPPVYAAN